MNVKQLNYNLLPSGTVVVVRECFHKHVSRILSTVGGSAPLNAGIHTPAGQTPTPGQTHPQADTLPGQTPPGRHTPLGQTPPTRQTHTPPGRHTLLSPWADTLPQAHIPSSPGTATAADDTHPTGMHSCVSCFFITGEKKEQVKKS